MCKIRVNEPFDIYSVLFSSVYLQVDDHDTKQRIQQCHKSLLPRFNWPQRSLEWQEVLVPYDDINCGFGGRSRRLSSFSERQKLQHSCNAGKHNSFDTTACRDAYAEFSDSDQELPPTMWIANSAKEAESDEKDNSQVDSGESPGWFRGVVGGLSLESPGENSDLETGKILLRLLAAFVTASSIPHRIAGLRVELVTTATQTPLYSLEKGIKALHVDASTIKRSKTVTNTHSEGILLAQKLLLEAGMLVIPEALDGATTQSLHQIARGRIQEYEAQMIKLGQDICCGRFEYSEICGRGKNRWDMLICHGGMIVGPGSQERNKMELQVLTRVATESPWSHIISFVLGDEYSWQASIVVSRPGAPAGMWHADGGHGKFLFEGKSPASPLERPNSNRFWRIPCQRMHSVLVGKPSSSPLSSSWSCGL